SLVPTDEVKTRVPGTLVGHGQEEMRLTKCADGDRWHVAQLVAGIPDFAGRVSETTVDRRLQTFALGGVERTGRDVEAKVIEVVARPRTLFDVIHGMTSPPFIPVHEADVQPAAVWTRTHARIGTGPAVCVVIFTRGLGEVDQAPCRGPRIPSVRARAIRPEAEVAERAVKEDERVVVSADEGGIADRARDAGPFDPVVDRPRLAGDEMRPRREMTSIQDVEVVGVIDPEDGRQMMIVGGRILSELHRVRPRLRATIVGDDVRVSGEPVGVRLVHDVDDVVVAERLRPEPNIEDHLLAAVFGKVPVLLVQRAGGDAERGELIEHGLLTHSVVLTRAAIGIM